MSCVSENLSKKKPAHPLIGALGVGLLTLSTTALLPQYGASAANFTSEDKAVIVLFRGAGGLLGSSSSRAGQSGIDSLATRIDRAFPDELVTTQVFDSYEGNLFNFRETGSRQGNRFLDSLGDEVGAVGLIGYSGGGLSAIRTAKKQSPNPIDLLIQIESYDPLTGRSREDEVLPSNVTKGINYYQQRNRFNFFRAGWDPSDLQGAKRVEGSNNKNVEALFNDRSITHRSIASDTRLHRRIVKNIRTSVVNQLNWTKRDELSVQSDAIAPASALSIAESDRQPGAETLSAVSTTSTHGHQPAQVPEPGAVLSLCLFGAALVTTKHQRQLKSHGKASSEA